MGGAEQHQYRVIQSGTPMTTGQALLGSVGCLKNFLVAGAPCPLRQLLSCHKAFVTPCDHITKAAFAPAHGPVAMHLGGTKAKGELLKRKSKDEC
eukprot:COSAG02_NODE_72_length_41961_cov_13.243658_17_plen_95_part_00